MLNLLILLLNLNLYSLEPAVKVMDLPQNDVLEAYEESEELFAMKVLEYYQTAIILSTQLNSIGVTPDEKVKAPSFEQLSDMELDLIIRYYNIAKSLESQIQNISGYDKSNNFIALKRKITELESEFTDSLWEVKNSYLLRELELKKEIEEKCNDKITKIENALKNNCVDCVNYLSISITENIFLGNFGGQLEIKPNVGVKIHLNALKPFGFGRYFEFWYEYQEPRFISQFDYGQGDINERWNSNLNVLGINTKFYPLISSKDLNGGLRLGAGYFWTSGKIFNREEATFSWEGMKVDLEFYGGVNNPRYPIDLFLNVGLFQSFSNDLVFDLANNNSINFNRTMFNISIGLRYNLWSSLY
jgi:NTP pyrophosphatase (non-canonical NTP hydrolase)